MDKIEKLYTIKEVCAILGVSRQTILRFRIEGKLKTVSFGSRNVRIKESELRKLLNEKEVL